jgi:hypothetical protein
MTAHRAMLTLLAICFGSSWSLARPKPAAIEVSVSVGPEEIAAGQIGEAEVIVQNVTDRAVTVTLDGVIEYADGTEDRLIHVTKRNAITIAPGQGFIINLLFFVPADTSGGQAIFTAVAKVVDVAGRGNGRYEKRAGDCASFEVVAP